MEETKDYVIADKQRTLSRPTVSALTITCVAIPAVVVTVALTVLLGPESIFKQAELSLVILSLATFIFLFAGLYYGVRLRYKRVDAKASDLLDLLWFPDFDLEFGLAGVLFWIVSTIVLVMFFLVFSGGIIWIIGALSWIIYRLLHLVFIKSKECHADLVLSARTAATFTFLYMGWLLGLVFVCEYLWQMKA